MRGIEEFTPEQIKYWNNSRKTIHGYKMARPLGKSGIFRRFRMAWKVFTGKSDVLTWHLQ